jgi:anti-anti-sigma factor
MKMIDEHIGDITILKIEGIFDADAAPAVGEFFQEISIKPLPYIIVNLSNVDFIDSSGLSTLVIGMKRCRQQNGTLVLYGTQGPVNSIFKLTLLDKVFAMFETQKEAIAYVQNQQKKAAMETAM